MSRIYRSKDFVKCISKLGFHRMIYDIYGEGRNIICVHGLTRNKSDFEQLGIELGENYRVITPDIVGRGESDYVGNSEIYNYQQYMQDATTLIGAAGCKKVIWIGTSMGAILGMMLAAQNNSPIEAMVINDVGTIIPSAALNRLKTYVGQEITFQSLDEAKEYFKKILASFGEMSDDLWDHLTKNSIIPKGPGFRLAYDSFIRDSFEKVTNDIDFSAIWKNINCPILLLRGADSDLFPKEVAKRMADKKNVKLIEFEGCGHAPSLKVPEHILAIKNWLNELNCESK